MKIINVVQGTQSWHEHRARSRNASEAAAMLGLSPYKTRTALLKEKATGLVEEVDENTQALFNRGHAAEASARANVEAMIGEELFPASATSDDGYLSASFDGITMDESQTWENKLFNQTLAAYIEANKDLPDSHWPQAEHQLIISNAFVCVFTLSDDQGNIKAKLGYQSKPERRKRILDGWKAFDADLAAYQHVEEKPQAVGRAPDALPALRIEVTGMVTASNLREFKEHALAVFAGINTDLQTDADFADAEKTVKWCGEVEERLDAAKQHALSQTASIDELFRAIDQIKAEARAKRLELDKLVKARKDGIRVEIKQEGELALRAHIETLNKRLGGKVQLPAIASDFAGVMKGKKTISSLREAVNNELLRCKLEANALADRMDINLQTLREMAFGKEFLFMDAQAIAQKSNDDLVNLVKARIAEHDAKEQARLDADRERIRKEEEAKAAAKVRAEEDAKQAIAAAQQDAPIARARGEGAEHKCVPECRPNAHIASPAPITKRPADAAIVAAIAQAFGVTRKQAVEWLFDLDLTKLEEEAA